MPIPVNGNPNEEMYMREGKEVERSRHNRQSPLQIKRNQCLREQLQGRHYTDRTEQRAAFSEAVRTCVKKYPRQGK